MKTVKEKAHMKKKFKVNSAFSLPPSPLKYALRPTSGLWRTSLPSAFRSSFTLIEMLVALSLLVMAMAITFSTFFSISRAWKRGQIMSEDMNRGEFIMEQLVCGLHSAFFPVKQSSSSSSATNVQAQSGSTNAAQTGAQVKASSSGQYGFILEDNGEGETARDAISWVKTGTALLGPEDPLWCGLHRVKITVEEDEDQCLAVASRAWRPYGNPLDFNPDDVAPFFISEKITGMNCRVAKESEEGKGWKWEDEWGTDVTNRLPLAVEITIYLEPIEDNEQTIEVKRVIEIPVAPLSWSVKKSGR
jgi:hypothetical protein